MDSCENYILDVAVLVLEAAAMGDAALAMDMDEARFRAHLLAVKADDAGYADLALAAANVAIVLGPVGTAPSPGYGAGILRVASELDALGLKRFRAPVAAARTGRAALRDLRISPPGCWDENKRK